jgi:hypothetical protein
VAGVYCQRSLPGPKISRTCYSAVQYGGVCFLGLILVPFTMTMSRKHSGTQITQSVLWALTANTWPIVPPSSHARRLHH